MQLLDDSVAKVTELESVITKFSSIQEHLLQTKTQKKEFVDFSRIVKIFEEITQEEQKLEQEAFGKQVQATLSMDRKLVTIVFRSKKKTGSDT